MYSSITNESEKEETTNITFYQLMTMTCNIVFSVE